MLRREKESADRKKVLAAKVEGLYNAKEQETFECDGNQSF